MAVGTPNSTLSGQQNNSYRVLYDETFDDKGFLNIQSLTQSRMVAPDTLNPVITYVMGNESKKFPLLFLTEGQMGGTKSIGIENIEYDWPVQGRTRYTSAIAGHEYTTGAKPGYMNTMIEIVFKDAWLKNQHNIVSPNGYKARVTAKPTKVSTGYKYILQPITKSDQDFIPLSEFTNNTLWAMNAGANASESYSFGNESNTQFPGKLKNQIGILRKSFEVAGNVVNKRVIFRLPTANGLTDYFMPHYEYTKELEFKEAVEESLWESTYNRDAFGRITTIDPDTQMPIPYASGLKEQIPNRDFYSVLTYAKLFNTVGDVMYGATDTDNLNVVLFTGKGGRREFSRAIEDKASGYRLLDGALNNTITGSPMSLTFGMAFDTFRHIDGHTVTIAELPMLDFGSRAANAPTHPETGWPLTSYEMHFVDMSIYEGQNNVQLVHQKGRQFVRGVEQGMTALKQGQLNTADASYGGNSNELVVSTSQDKSSIHMLKTCGVALKRNTHCFSLYCDIS